MAKKGMDTKDALLIKEKALPTSASTVYTDAIDLGPISDEKGVRSERFGFKVSAPALSATQLPSGASVAYKIQGSNDSTFSTGVAEYDVLTLSQTGGSSGAAGKTDEFRPAMDSPRYWRLAATVTGTVASSTANAKISMEYVC